jgi:hypothetical protein
MRTAFIIAKIKMRVMHAKQGALVPFKIFGLQRTATNLTAALLEKNFLVESIEKSTEWKHGPVEEPHRRWHGVPVRFVICVKHPHAWLVSCYRYFQRVHRFDHTMPPQFRQDPSITFDQFLRLPCYEFANPMDWWNHRYLQWKQALPPRQTAIIRQEELMQDQIAVLTRLETGLDLSRRTPRLHEIRGRVDIIPNSHGRFNRRYHAQRRYVTIYSAAALAYVQGQLDLDLAAELGYPMDKSKTIDRPVRTPASQGHPTVKREAIRKDRLTIRSAHGAAVRFIDSIGPYPASRFQGRGIVICAGGPRYFPCAWVCINMLRHLGVTLPIEMWGLNSLEIDGRTRSLVAPLGVRCVNAHVVRKRYPVRILEGWELKPYSILHSSFEEVLFLDADNVPIADPAKLFNSAPYKQHGAIFWPCYLPIQRSHPIWKVCGVPYRREPDFESGQMIINKARCWEALNLAMHMNENSDFYYKYARGDRDTFHMAWRKLEQEYAMIPFAMKYIESTACQHDFRGRRLFQHRFLAKWNLDQPNEVIRGFKMEDVCFRYLDELYKRTR